MPDVHVQSFDPISFLPIGLDVGLLDGFVSQARDLLCVALCRVGKGEELLVGDLIKASMVLLDFEMRRREHEAGRKVAANG